MAALVAVAAVAAGCGGNDVGGPLGWTYPGWSTGSPGQQHGPAGQGNGSGGSSSGGSGSTSSGGGWSSSTSGGSTSGGGGWSSGGSGSGGGSSSGAPTGGGSGGVPQGGGDDGGGTVGSGDDAGGGAPPDDSGGGGPGPTRDAGGTQVATFTLVYQSALVNCSSCHGGGSPAGNLDLSSQSAAYSNLVGVKASGPSCGASGETRVVAGNAGGSLLYNKVNGSQDCGNQMFTAGPNDVALVKSWIDNGAAND